LAAIAGLAICEALDAAIAAPLAGETESNEAK